MVWVVLIFCFLFVTPFVIIGMCPDFSYWKLTEKEQREYLIKMYDLRPRKGWHIAFKGFDKTRDELSCLGFIFKKGEKYHVDNPFLCHKGFHACIYPADCETYYNGAGVEYRAVYVKNMVKKTWAGGDSKICAGDILIGKKIDSKYIVAPRYKDILLWTK